MKFTTTVFLGGKTATGLPVPEEAVAALGPAKRYPVVVTVHGYSYRSSVARYNGDFMIALSAENREAAGLKAGDEVEVEMVVDTEPREVEIPADFAEALSNAPVAKIVFEKLSYSHQRQHILAIEGAKTSETRVRRIDKAIETLTASVAQR